MGRKKIFPDSIKFYYLEEAEFTTEIIKILSLPPPHDCALNMREEIRKKKEWKRKICWHIWSVVFAVTVKCLVFLLIICDTFLHIDRNPQMGDSIDWMWFGKVQTCLCKVSQLAMHIRVKTTSHEVEKLRTRTVQIHWIWEIYRNVLLQFRL